MQKEKTAKLVDQKTHTLSLEERRAIGEQARQQVPLEAHWSGIL